MARIQPAAYSAAKRAKQLELRPSSRQQSHRFQAYDANSDTVELEDETALDLVGVRLWADGLHILGIYIVHGFEDLEVHPHGFVLPRQWQWKYRTSS